MRTVHARMWAGAAVALLALLAGPAWGGVLSGDPLGLAGFHGSKLFDTVHKVGTRYFAADIDYCVYAPNHWNTMFNSLPLNKSHYLYAYQIVQVYDGLAGAGYVSKFSVGLTLGDVQVTTIGYVPGTGLAPSDSSLPTGTATWTFNPAVYKTTYSNPAKRAPSAVIYFTSPRAPDWDNASVAGTAVGDTLPMPSPIPEPATLSLLVLGFALSLSKGGLAVLCRRR